MTKTALFAGLAALALASAAHAAEAPVCKPAALAVPNQVPVGGGPNAGRDASRAYTVAAIPGVVAGGATWTKVWQKGGNSADGMVPDKDGAVLFAGEDFDTAFRLDAADKETRPVTGVGGLSSLAMDRRGNLYGVTRSERPGSTKPNKDEITNSVVQLTPTRRVFGDKWEDGSKLTIRPNDLIVDASGGAYMTSGCVYYAGPKGVSVAAENLRTNGITLSGDERTLFVTNGSSVVAFDVTGPGQLSNRRDFAQLPSTDSGDGIALDSEGRLYVATVAAAVPGVHVFDRTGKHLGLIAAPRPLISLAFGGKDKKTLYAVGSGADDANGQLVHEGPQQTAATVYRIPVQTAGLKERGK